MDRLKNKSGRPESCILERPRKTNAAITITHLRDLARSRIDEAKARLTIPVLWTIFHLRGKPAKSCRSPFRDDRSPSFSVSDDGRHWRDFATGEAGDAIDFLGRIQRVNTAQAFLAFLELAESYVSNHSQTTNHHDTNILHPKLAQLSEANLARLSKVRAIPVEGLRIAKERNLLWRYHYQPENCECWLVTDDYQRNAIIRRLDGKPFTGNRKSLCVKGSEANWPIGIARASKYPTIALCEGGPDFLAGFYLAWAGGVEHVTAPVCMTGASCSIHLDALPLLRGKRVRIFAHDDEPGQRALIRWAEQLRKVQVEVDAFYFAGIVKVDSSAVKDLNDFIGADHKRSGCGIEVVTGAFDFAAERRNK